MLFIENGSLTVRQPGLIFRQKGVRSIHTLSAPYALSGGGGGRFGISRLHTGHALDCASHGSMHSLWYICVHASCLNKSPSSNSSKHTAHTGASSSSSPPPTTRLFSSSSISLDPYSSSSSSPSSSSTGATSNPSSSAPDLKAFASPFSSSSSSTVDTNVRLALPLPLVRLLLLLLAPAAPPSPPPPLLSALENVHTGMF
mmetsp:Transcript_7364/g.15725  ORF Transcript_7364/g.15725 Transcript_7364/m.15725 type:complete len:200 (-) Transcript_7364:45-644(-)